MKVSRKFNDRTQAKRLVERYPTRGYTPHYLLVQCLMPVRYMTVMAPRTAWKPIIFSNWEASDVISAALSLYGDGERDGDGDSVVETVECTGRESCDRYILTVTAIGDVQTSLI